MKKVHVFVDNSNLFIEGKRVAKIDYVYDVDQLHCFRIEYGRLLDLIKSEREMGTAVLVGSRPPKQDTLWNKLKSLGLQPRIFDRSQFTGREKGVDAELINAIRDVMEDSPEKGVIALVAGDLDYLSTMERCVQKGWDVEIYFWSNAASKLKNLSGAKFIDLDQSFPRITFQDKRDDIGDDKVSEGTVIYIA